MLIHEFKYEDKTTKIDLLLHHGVYLAWRPNGDFALLLFQIHSFYVEVYWDVEEQRIGYIRAFSSVDQLAPYLPAVDISEAIRVLAERNPA